MKKIFILLLLFCSSLCYPQEPFSKELLQKIANTIWQDIQESNSVSQERNRTYGVGVYQANGQNYFVVSSSAPRYLNAVYQPTGAGVRPIVAIQQMYDDIRAAIARCLEGNPATATINLVILADIGLNSIPFDLRVDNPDRPAGNGIYNINSTRGQNEHAETAILHFFGLVDAYERDNPLIVGFDGRSIQGDAKQNPQNAAPSSLRIIPGGFLRSNGNQIIPCFNCAGQLRAILGNRAYCVDRGNTQSSVWSSPYSPKNPNQYTSVFRCASSGWLNEQDDNPNSRKKRRTTTNPKERVGAFLQNGMQNALSSVTPRIRYNNFQQSNGFVNVDGCPSNFPIVTSFRKNNEQNEIEFVPLMDIYGPDYGLTEEIRVTSQDSVDLSGRFFGTIQVETFEDAFDDRAVQVICNIERNVDEENDIWEIEEEILERVVVERDMTLMNTFNYGFDILEGMPSGTYRIRFAISKSSDFHFDRDPSNNEVISEFRVVTKDTRRILPDDVDFSFTDNNSIVSQSILDQTGRLTGAVEFTIDRDNTKNAQLPIQFVLERSEDGAPGSWVAIREFEQLTPAVGAENALKQVGFSFDISTCDPNGLYRVQAVIPVVSAFHFDRNVSNNITVAGPVSVTNSTTRIDTGVVDFSFGPFQKIENQEKFDKKGKFEGEFELLVDQENKDNKKVLILYSLQRQSLSNPATWITEEVLFEDTSAPKKPGKSKKAKYKFEITTEMPNGSYRVVGEITDRSQYHEDCNLENNLVFSPIRIVSDTTKRKKAKKSPEEELEVLESAKPDLLISPNPASDIVQVQLDTKTMLQGEISLINIQGAMVIKEVVYNTKTTNLNVATLSNGIYFIKYQDQNGSQNIEKIIIQN